MLASVNNLQPETTKRSSPVQLVAIDIILSSVIAELTTDNCSRPLQWVDMDIIPLSFNFTSASTISVLSFEQLVAMDVIVSSVK